MSAQPAAAWEPGDPLYTRASYRDYLYNFRPDALGPEPGHDAASWPDPRASQNLDNHADELGDFIAYWHAWNAQQQPSAPEETP